MINLFVLGQVVLGAFFVLSGLKHFMKSKDMIAYSTYKKLPQPALAVYFTGLVLIVGGLGVMTQMYLTYSYGMLIAFLLAAAFLMHNFWAATDPQAKSMDMIQFQKNIALAAALAMLLSQSLSV
jgi:uncharacterized membrane protein YphA (DoxX/SURF4 family)